MRIMLGPRMLHEAENRQFELLPARESTEGCYSLELWDVAPTPGLGLLASASRYPDTGRMSFMSFTGGEIPLSAMEWFMSHARTALDPAGDQPSELTSPDCV
jgi:hypothetical protein